MPYLFDEADEQYLNKCYRFKKMGLKITSSRRRGVRMRSANGQVDSRREK
jgi:hypothetical protein